MDSLITHPALGTGKVVKHIPPNKMDVEFEEGVKRLVCGKISGVAPTEYNEQRAAPLEYFPYGIFQVGDIIQHVRFGTGEVIKYIHPSNIDAKFPVGVRRLKCGCHPKRFASDYLSSRSRPESKNEITLTVEDEKLGHVACGNVFAGKSIVAKTNDYTRQLNLEQNNDIDSVESIQRSRLLPYSPDKLFPVDCTIAHNTLGIGEVIRYANQNEIDVRFPSGTVRLRCGRLPESLLDKYLSHDNSIELLQNNKSRSSGGKFEPIDEHGENNVCDYANDQHSEFCRAAKLAGFDSNDAQSKKILQQLLADWNYDKGASAQIAYSKPSIERLQLLRQIADLLKNGMGFSQLYNMLELRRGQSERERAYAAGKRLQPWTGLTSSARLRSFVEENEDFLCGRVVNGKWEPTPLPQGNCILHYTIDNELHETPSSNDTFTEKLTQILSLRFPTGYRLDSPIEMVRFRSFAAEVLDRGVRLSDEELKNRISACGITYDGKVYAVSEQAEDRIKNLVEKYFATGAQVIFFAEFYAKNELWLFESSIISEEMLLAILSRLFHKLSFTQTYFGYTSASVSNVLESEILRVWGDDVLLTYEQLAARLQYIPIERIRSILGQNKDFIWNNIGTFSHISRIYIGDNERETIIQATTQECNNSGYVSLATLHTDEIEAQNSCLSITAVHGAIFRICLSDKFDKHGKIVTRKGDRIDALSIMKEHCRTIDKCSLDDLFNYEKELTGSVNRWISMEAGNTILVRIDKDTYVSDKYVYFDSDAVDAAIEMFITNNYLPLKFFTTFGTFPDCGQTWNLFLLESYCRRFSKKFRFDSLSVNSQNIGVIIRKVFNLKYIDILANAVISVGVPLTNSAVGEFLLNSGYIGRKRTSVLSEVIGKAKAIQQRVD